MLNQFSGVGRLVKDPELRKTNSDVSFATFTIAIDNPIKEVDGTRGTLFLDGRAFNVQAENIVKFCRKGSKIAIGGSLAQRNFIKQDGSKGRVYEVIVNSIEFLDPKPVQEDEDDDGDGPYESCGSLDGEQYEDENGETKQVKAIPPKPKYDPMTGKPLKPKAKK